MVNSIIQNSRASPCKFGKLIVGERGEVARTPALFLFLRQGIFYTMLKGIKKILDKVKEEDRKLRKQEEKLFHAETKEEVEKATKEIEKIINPCNK